MNKRLISTIVSVLFFIGGVSLGYALVHSNWLSISNLEVRLAIILLPGLLAGMLAYSFAPTCIERIVYTTDWVENRLQRMPLTDLLGAAIGLIFGLIIASLLGSTFARIPVMGNYISIISSLLFAYLGIRLGMKKKEELFGLFNFFPRASKEKERPSHSEEGDTSAYKILDTSVIIDGRIADICQTGFIDGVLVAPSFILEELRHIADSSDLLKRNRGRRGLDILNKIRKELDIKVVIDERDFGDLSEVDSKLVRLAQLIGGDILTNDYNLNKVAELQGVKVLNINELVNALKPIFLPGEEMIVQIVKDGKESKQGIGYLDDGTMIVVDSGKKYINQTIHVVVTSMLQTAAGRMIFAKPKYNDNRTLYEVDAIG